MWNVRSAHADCNLRRGNSMNVELDRRALAKNLYIMMGGTDEDRMAAAGQLIAAFKAYYNVKLHAKRKSAIIEMDDIPPIVQMIKSGRFPWG